MREKENCLSHHFSALCSSVLKMYFNDSGAVKIQAVIIQAGRGVGADLKREVLLLLHILL